MTEYFDYKSLFGTQEIILMAALKTGRGKVDNLVYRFRHDVLPGHWPAELDRTETVWSMGPEIKLIEALREATTPTVGKLITKYKSRARARDKQVDDYLETLKNYDLKCEKARDRDVYSENYRDRDRDRDRNRDRDRERSRSNRPRKSARWEYYGF